jgi:hypothetical protein
VIEESLRLYYLNYISFNNNQVSINYNSQILIEQDRARYKFKDTVIHIY